MSGRAWPRIADAEWSLHAQLQWVMRGRAEDPAQAWQARRYLGRWKKFYGWASGPWVMLVVLSGWPQHWVIITVWPQAWWDERVTRWAEQEDRAWRGEGQTP